MSIEAMGQALTTSSLCKKYGEFAALTDVSINLTYGTLTAVMGENGAGKSTLIRQISGIEVPSSGSVTIQRGSQSQLARPADLDRFVAVVPQEIDLAEERTVAENVFMGIEPGNWFFPSPRKLASRTQELLNWVESEIDPLTKVQDLDAASKQMVLIVRALAREADVLIFDEPTANLSPVESEALFRVIRKLKADGKALLYVSHRIPEVMDLSERIEILRDGVHVESFVTAETQAQQIVNAMVGRDVDLNARRRAKVSEAAPVLVVKKLRAAGIEGVSFELKPGEILGVAGLPDSGREELLQVLFGASPRKSGEVLLNGVISSPTVRGAIQQGFAYLPGERRAQGILPTLSVKENIYALIAKSETTLGMLNKKKLSERAEQLAKLVNVKAASLDLPITALSGGNQQKALISRLLATDPKLLLLDEPTRGVDVGAKAEIYAVIDSLAQKGMAVLLSSSDLPELLGQASKIAVMHQGRIAAFLDGDTATEEQIMAYATLGHEIEIKESA